MATLVKETKGNRDIDNLRLFSLEADPVDDVKKIECSENTSYGSRETDAPKS